MSKAVISNKIYMSVSKELMTELAKKLTYKIEVIRSKTGRYNTVETIRHYSIPKDGVIAIPQGRLDLIPEGFEIVDNRTKVEVELPYPKIELRESQIPVVENWEDSGILNARVGWGKSYAALWIAWKLGQKALVVAHNTMLRDQWASDIEKMFGIKPAIVGSGEFNIDCPIVVGNVQTLTKHAQALASEFGTIILDEMHHCPATTFNDIIAASKARYRIGLSGTMERKDKKHILFKDFFGSYLVKPPQSNTMIPVVRIIQSGRTPLPSAPYVKQINELMEDEDYRHFIAGLARAQVVKGHKVLIISDRVGFAHAMGRLLHDCIVVTGESASFDDREEAKQLIQTPDFNIISGTRPIFAEGISINCLSCIILTCPIAGEGLLEQLIGRIMREYPGKIQPEVLDINFSGKSAKSQNNLRLSFYLLQGWKVDLV